MIMMQKLPVVQNWNSEARPARLESALYNPQLSNSGQMFHLFTLIFLIYNKDNQIPSSKSYKLKEATYLKHSMLPCTC